jgi:thiol-disulfide isomerase/thioredoxin
MSGATSEKKPRRRASLFPIIAAAAAMAGVYAYYRFAESEAPERTATEIASPDSARPSPGAFPAPDSGGFSFNTYDEPRPLPRVPFTDGGWRELTLEAFRGKVVLLNIWATWCVPCREEMPTLDRLQAKLGGPDFQVVALSIDQEGIFAVKKFYEELALESLDIYVDDSMRAPSLLGVIGIPATLLIDREGREIGRKLGPAEWDSEEVVTLIRRYVE